MNEGPLALCDDPRCSPGECCQSPNAALDWFELNPEKVLDAADFPRKIRRLRAFLARADSIACRGSRPPSAQEAQTSELCRSSIAVSPHPGGPQPGFNEFRRVVKAARPEIEDASMAGQVFTGKEAKAAKLVDQVGDMNFALSILRREIRARS